MRRVHVVYCNWTHFKAGRWPRRERCTWASDGLIERLVADEAGPVVALLRHRARVHRESQWKTD